MRKLMFSLAAACILAAPVNADIITKWTFDSVPPDDPIDTTTGTLDPAIGSGTVSLAPGITFTYATGFPNSAGDNSGLNTVPLARPSSSDPVPDPSTRWIEFAAGTTGYQNIVISWEQRWSNTAANTVLLQLTSDGVNWTDYTTYQAGGANNFYSYTFDLTGVAGVDNNPLFGFRLLPEVDPTTGELKAAGPTSTFSTNGTWRFDNVTLRGEEIPPVPEPMTMALVGSGLAIVAAIRRRK